MPVVQERNLDKLEKLLAVIDEGVSKEEFVQAFEHVMNLVLKNERQLAEAIDRLEKTYAVLLKKTQDDHASNLSDLKNRVDDLFVKDQLKRMDSEMKNGFAKLQTHINSAIGRKLNDMDSRMSKVKDGERGPAGPMGPMGLTGKIDGGELAKLKEDIEALKRLPRGRMGMRKVPIVRSHRLTGDVDGSTRSFNLPKDTVRVLGLWGTQFPVTFDENDWSLSGNTLTLADQIATPQGGQTLIAIIETLFY